MLNFAFAHHVSTATLLVMSAGCAVIAVVFILQNRARIRPRSNEHPVTAPRAGTVFAVIGGELSQWPAPGATGPIPTGGRVVAFPASIDSLGSEVWLAQRQGENITLLERVERFDEATALSWAADCVEHAAQSIAGTAVQEMTHKLRDQIVHTVAACVAFARQRAVAGTYDTPGAAELVAAMKHLQTSEDLQMIGSTVLSSLTSGWFRRPRTQSAVELLAETPAARPLLNAGAALLNTDPMDAAARASALAQHAVSLKNGSGPVERYTNPSRMDPLTMLTNGARPEAAWQMQRLKDYLSDRELAPNAPVAPPPERLAS